MPYLGGICMRVIKPQVEILDEINGDEILRKIERAGRVCYKSEERITPDSAKALSRIS